MYKKLTSGKGDAPRDTRGQGEHATWKRIREWSVLEFTNRVMQALEVPYGNREIMSWLMTMALRDGEGTIRWRGVALSGEMILDVWRGSFAESRGVARETLALIP